MAYALVVNGQISLATQYLPDHLANATVPAREAQGWYEVLAATRPADTQTTTWSSGFIMQNGRPIEVWTSVAKSAKQIEEETRGAQSGITRNQVLAAYARLMEITNYTPPTITSGNIIAEVTKTMDALQDVAASVAGLARLTIGGELLDEG